MLSTSVNASSRNAILVTQLKLEYGKLPEENENPINQSTVPSMNA